MILTTMGVGGLLALVGCAGLREHREAELRRVEPVHAQPGLRHGPRAAEAPRQGRDHHRRGYHVQPDEGRGGGGVRAEENGRDQRDCGQRHRRTHEPLGGASAPAEQSSGKDDARDREEARRAVFNYIEMFYNSKRRHGYANSVSPVEFENQYFNRLQSVY